VYVPVTSPAGRTVVRTFVPAALLREGVARAVLVLGLLGAALLVMAVLFADRLARWMLRPVTALAGTANRLGSGDLTARVAPEGPPEIAKVGQALNRLADRITDLLRHEREIVADLSHRLRTPLAALRLDVEGLRNPDEAVRLGDHMDALQRMVDDVIVQARRPERADRAGAADQCDAVAVVRDRVAFWAVLAEDTGREFRLLLPGIARPVPVPAHDLAAAVDALLENVFAHTPDGTSMSVWIDAAAERTQIIVSDDGPGLPSPAVAGRGHSRGGSTGLGLDIARRIARGSGGTLLLGASPTGGAEVVLDLGPVRA
jgi:signal transduction histidine kinase